MTNILEQTTKAPTLSEMDDTQVIAYLAGLGPLDYDRQRDNAAKQLKVGVKALDKEVMLATNKSDNDSDVDMSAMFPEVEMYSEKVNGSDLLDRINAACQHYVICDKTTRSAVTLWVVLTWLTEHVECLPIANITAPEKNCGKSTLLSFIGKLAFKPLVTSNITSSALFRSIEKWQPTLLIDEADSFSDDDEALRGIINAGHTKESAYVIRCSGEDHEPKKFTVWGAKAIAGIGKRAGTIESRSIDLRLRRKNPNETIGRMKKGGAEFAIIQQQLARWTNDIAEQIKEMEPVLPNQLQNRDADNWEPLIVIADCAGGDWPQLARTAALELTKSNESPSVAQELLGDIQSIFDEKTVIHIFSADLLEALLSIEDAPWLTYNRGKPFTTRQLSKQLSGYGIKPSTKRIGTVTKKGYSVTDFSDSFARYLTPLNLSVTTSQRSNDVGCSDFSSDTSSNGVTDRKSLQANKDGSCDGVTDKNALQGQSRQWSEAI